MDDECYMQLSAITNSYSSLGKRISMIDIRINSYETIKIIFI